MHFWIKLSLGVGSLLLLLAGLGVMSWMQMHHIDTLLNKNIAIHEPKYEATIEMSAYLTGLGSELFGYLHTLDPRHLNGIKKNRDDFKKYLFQYESLISTSEEMGLVRQIENHFATLNKIIDTALERNQVKKTKITRLNRQLHQIDMQLNQEMHNKQENAVFNQMEKTKHLAEMRLYIYAPMYEVMMKLYTHQTKSTLSVFQNKNHFLDSLHAYQALELSKEELGFIKNVRLHYQKSSSLSSEILDMQLKQTSDLKQVAVLVRNTDHILHVQIQKPAHLNVIHAETSMIKSSQEAQTRSANMVMIGCVLGLLFTIFIVRGLNKHVSSLSRAVKAMAEGDFTQRVRMISKDELGMLGQSFNWMAENIERQTDELALRAKYDNSYGETMALFSSTDDEQEALSGLLAMLAENHPFPVSAIYTPIEWNGHLVCAASHGAPETMKTEIMCQEGLIGQAASDGKTIIIDDIDQTKNLSIETGLLSFTPAAIIISPIHYQQQFLGVLVLVSSHALVELDRKFIARLTTQFGSVLNNLNQYEDLKHLSEQLRQRSEEINRKNQQLEDSNRMKSEFLANMSHELRTPLNAIIGFSEILKDGVVGEMNNIQQEYSTDIFLSGQHLLDLINDILDLSKIEAGKMEMFPESIYMPDILKNSLSMLREKAAANGVSLQLEVSEEVNHCFLDVRKTKQIIFNLLSNAVKFTPQDGEVNLTARMVQGEEVNVLVVEKMLDPKALVPDQTYLEISVADTGIGICEEDQKQLFQPFMQVDSSLARQFEGSGLGLAMVKRLVALHAGTVALESEQGEGSAFTVWLSARDHEIDEEESINHDASLMEIEEAKHSSQALVIEDESKTASLMRVQLESDGYQVEVAVSAEDAFEWLKEHTPDLITLDILLPGMDGWGFLSQIKEDEHLKSIPVVIVSIVAEGNQDRAFTLGAAGVLQKPIRKKNLLEAVAGVRQCEHQDDQSVTVLVVDDDPHAVEIVSRHLMQQKHYNVLRAYGGAEAIATAFKKLPDMILLDLMMPDVSGFDVVEALKAKPETASIPIIIITAKVVSDEDRKKMDVTSIVDKVRFKHGTFMDEVSKVTKETA